MKKFRFNFLGVLLFAMIGTLLEGTPCFADPQEAQLASLPLSDLWQLEKAGKIVDHSFIPKNRHVPFVPGVMNELSAMPYFPNLVYYKSNRAAAEQLGMTTSYVPQDSSKSIPYDAAVLYHLINLEYRRVQKPLILVGHSKGGAEILYCILKHPELILGGKVDRVILIQAALGGSPLADADSGFIVKTLGLLPIPILRPNTLTLSTKEAAKNFNQAFRDYETYFEPYRDKNNSRIAKMKKRVSDRIYYVRSAAKPEKLSFAIELILRVLLNPEGLNAKQDDSTLKDAAGSFLQTQYSGLNDGLLPVEAQMDPRIGVDLGILEGDHADFTVGWVSSTQSEDRETLTRAILDKIYLQVPADEE